MLSLPHSVGLIIIVLTLRAVLVPAPALADAATFDASAYEKKPFELRGYAEIETGYADTSPDGALYQLEFHNDSPRSSITRMPAALEIEGRYRLGPSTFSFRTHSSKVFEYRDEEAEHLVYEGLASFQFHSGLTLDVGKKTYRWGKGYAWNPVAFVERAKDAGNPDLAREGFWTVGFDWIRTFDGPLQTIAFTPLVLPHKSDLNNDFGQPGYNKFAAKLYFLYRDIDIDLMVLGDGSRSARYGMDFAKNITSNFEIHGELAYVKDVAQRRITGDCRQRPARSKDVWSYLLGLRYRTEDDATFIAEYYFNGAGNREQDQRRFYDCVHRAWETGDAGLVAGLPIEADLDRGPFTKPNSMRHCLNLRAWWNEPFDILYFIPGIQILQNLDDKSFSISPELNYRAMDDFDFRLRATIPIGDRLTEWGEKPNDYKVELRVRYYF